MPHDRTAQRRKELLFAEPASHVFAILDGASVPALRRRLWQHEPDHCCLFRDVPGPAMAEVAPYVVRLEPDSEFAGWVIDEGWGNHWGIFAVAQADLRAVRNHCRGLIDAYDPDGQPVIFRYYDPRVFRAYLPTCTPAECREVFGPVRYFLAEDAGAATMLRYRLEGPHLRVQRHRLSAPEAVGAAADAGPRQGTTT